MGDDMHLFKTGQLECDLQMVHPITFRILPPLSKHFIWGLYQENPAGLGDISSGVPANSLSEQALKSLEHNCALYVRTWLMDWLRDNRAISYLLFNWYEKDAMGHIATGHRLCIIACAMK